MVAFYRCTDSRPAATSSPWVMMSLHASCFATPAPPPLARVAVVRTWSSLSKERLPVHPPILVFLATGLVGSQVRWGSGAPLPQGIDLFFPSHPILSTLASSDRLLPRSPDYARHLFDGMPRRKKRQSAPPVSVADRIGTLPDSLLHHVLSFLPVQAVVRTCVLARRWRHLWRSTTSLRIVGLDDNYYVDVEELRKFVDHFLILRERTDLDLVEIKFNEFCEEDQPYVKTWVRFALMCKVRRLTFHVRGSQYLYLDPPLVSRHLRTLDLDGVGLPETFLDIGSCPVLEDLKISHCIINACRILSHSLKHLSIYCCHNEFNCRIHVSTPCLVSLKLDHFIGRTPLLENMALLESADVYLSDYCKDVCLNYDSGVLCGSNNNACQNCVPIEDDCSRECVLLGGISNAKYLKLLPGSKTFVFTRDLKHCPTFIKLKTLLLNEYWCEAPDLDPLACILKNSPVLEKLTLQLFSEGPNHKVEIKGRYSSMERPSAISEHLNIVEVKCSVVDERILKVLKFLSALNICFIF
ncbi:F-box/FBD/LRR-repeat protein At5g22700-like [Lolium rigidum]|uniref:F-box/FBD/LRR-repeat protein At5g22700-like n=1 Tax=Lolium rigidum TaxID=89674 RepID=UPI001F5E1451|nr:F-box/FBD/LRR-repeat protein At5g22700-like [Lolium rigidum]